MPDLIAIRPAEPQRGPQVPRGRGRRGGSRRDPGPVAPDPRQPGAGVRGAPGRDLGRRGPARARVRASSTRRAASRRPSGRCMPAAAAATARGSGSSPSTTRCPVSGTAAATTRWRRPGSGAAIALAAVADELPGEIVFLGTPAEERGSGKQIMIDDGLFAGIDAALLYHPCDRNHVESHRSRPRTSRSCSPGCRPTPRPIRGGGGTRSTR